MKLTLGQKIRELRIRKGLTQSELSEGLVTPSMISQIESDKANPSHQLLSSIAEKLETPIEYFLTDVESQLDKVSAYYVAHAVMLKGEYQQAIELLSRIKEAPSTQISMADIKYDLAYCYLHLNELDKANDLFDECLEIAITGKDSIRMITIMNQLGTVTFKQKNYPIAIHYWKKAYDLASKAADVDPYLVGEIANGIGIVHSQFGEWEQAKEYFAEAVRLFKGSHNISQIADVYVELAKTYRNIGDFERAMNYSQSASALYQGLQSLRTVIDSDAHYGVVLGETGSALEGIEKLETCMVLYENTGFPDRAGYVHSALARALFQAGEYEKATVHCEEALNSNTGDDSEKATIYRILATIDLQKEKYDSALEWIEKAASIAEKTGSAADQVKVYSVYGDIYKKQGMYREAMECLEKMNNAMLENLRDQKVIL
jgi:tetratricopeptide (TPR) repeat protein